MCLLTCAPVWSGIVISSGRRFGTCSRIAALRMIPFFHIDAQKKASFDSAVSLASKVENYISSENRNDVCEPLGVIGKSIYK